MSVAWSSLIVAEKSMVGDEGWIGPSRKLLFYVKPEKFMLLLGRSSCSSPSTKELHECGVVSYLRARLTQ